mmetsp:Transcript_22974/g.54504  ORF Transcript_22974/g.54504 Transcript_22974/m.54504 type:complete len:533 (-) Transcript_22974:1544-3142(-)
MSNNNGLPLSSLMCAIEATDADGGGISDERLRKELFSFLDKLPPKDDVLIVPPDYTRFHSQAGKITQMIAQYYKFIPSTNDDGESSTAIPSKFQIMPALGTHAPMTDTELESMYGTDLANKKVIDGSGNSEGPFLVHKWRTDVTTIGHVDAKMVEVATRGMVKDRPWPAQLNCLVWSKRQTTPARATVAVAAPKANDDDTQSDDKTNQDISRSSDKLVISVGQVVPHEVMGMANFNKNLFVGVGGLDAINLSHFIGAVYGMENMMGKANNPLRDILNQASEQFLQTAFSDDLWYILTVVAPDPASGQLQLKGLYIGNTIECYNRACQLSLKVNFKILGRSPSKMVVYLDVDEFHSTWLGNKSIYRTRMAIADGGELIVLAPGVERFGEDDTVDKLIRKYGYFGTPQTMKNMEENDELKDNLSAVAHLIHGSSEGRFRIRYCPGHLTKDEVEGVGFDYGDLTEMSKKYDVKNLQTGWNEDPDTGEEFYFISNPALGLWAVESRFEKSDNDTKNDSRSNGDEEARTTKKPRTEK